MKPETELQKEIYETWKLWNKDVRNRQFYEQYVHLCIGDYSPQAEFYLTYWEGLKKYGDNVYCYTNKEIGKK